MSNTLIIKIENDRLNILSLVKTLKSIDNGVKKQTFGKSKIYIKEVYKGSLVFEIIQILSSSTLPFIENTNTFIAFIENLNKYKKMLLSKDKNLDDKNVDDCENIETLSGISSSVRGNPNANIYITNNINIISNININFSLNGIEANIIIDEVKSINEASNSDDNICDSVENALLYFTQTNINKKADRAICEKISKKPTKIIFKNETIKKEILENPYNYNFVVDMEIQYIEDKPKLYTINALKEKWQKDKV